MSNAGDLWIDRYLAHLGTERRLSDHTVTNYRRDLNALSAYMR